MIRMVRHLLLLGSLAGVAVLAMPDDRYSTWPARAEQAWKSRFKQFGPDQDARVEAPRGGWSGPVVVDGGRHVVLDGRGQNVSRLSFKHTTGSVTVANLRIALTQDGDAIAVASRNGRSPDVTLRNIVVEGVRGTREGVHGDIFQGQGDIGKLRITDLVGSSGYQGIFLKGTADRAVGSAHLERVALSHSGEAAGFLLWLGDGIRTSPDGRRAGNKAAPRFPVYLKDVYVTPRPGQDLTRSIYPNRGVVDAQGRDIGAYSTDGGKTWRWPPAANIHGVVISGPPPRGLIRPPGTK
jgi:hypothetical protein